MSTSTTVRCCNDTYERREDGSWWYAWGARVPGAADLTTSAALQVLGAADDPAAAADASAGGPLARELIELAARFGLDRPVSVPRRDGGRHHIVGLSAPELHAPAMLTVAGVAEVAGVSKATIDSYRYRGYLPEPQVVRGRTPLWARPVIRHWATHRPGAGWRTDVYGTREHRPPARAYPISRARAAAELRRRRTLQAKGS